MYRLGLIGYPLGHSKSVQFFAEKFDKENVKDYSYTLFSLADIKDFPKLLDENREITGLNVTIPYKKSILNYVDYEDDIVKAVNAANVLTIRYDGDERFISAYNTDVLGIENSLAYYWDDDITSALILGTGGAANAVAYVLRQHKIMCHFVSRTPINGMYGYNDLDRFVLGRADLIINTTPVGMFPNISSKPPLNYSYIRKETILFDVVYNPEKTLFLQEGEAIGCRTITGLSMFSHQAEHSWRLFNR